MTQIKRALISLSDKSGAVAFARGNFVHGGNGQIIGRC